jgi:hypothetical protein
MQLDGIFFDETPAAYSNDSFAYLQNVSTAVHDMDGLAQKIVGRWRPFPTLSVGTLCTRISPCVPNGDLWFGNAHQNANCTTQSITRARLQISATWTWLT